MYKEEKTLKRGISLKPLPKSFREANRYILFRISLNATDTKIPSFGTFEKLCFQTLTHCIGSLNLPKCDVMLVKDQYKSIKNAHYGVLKTNAKGLKQVRVALGLIGKIEGQNCDFVVKPILTTSQLRKVKEYANTKSSNDGL